MQLLRFDATRGDRITAFESRGASAVPLGDGRGEGHVYCVSLKPGGVIGPHEAGFDQLFLVVAGSGWVSGSDEVPHAVGRGEGAFIARGEVHAKGSRTGLTAIMVQLSELTPRPVAFRTAREEGEPAGTAARQAQKDAEHESWREAWRTYRAHWHAGLDRTPPPPWWHLRARWRRFLGAWHPR
jgi:quercetin dioxygenase-like cupin family protein